MDKIGQGEGVGGTGEGTTAQMVEVEAVRRMEMGGVGMEEQGWEGETEAGSGTGGRVEMGWGGQKRWVR